MGWSAELMFTEGVPVTLTAGVPLIPTVPVTGNGNGAAMVTDLPSDCAVAGAELIANTRVPMMERDAITNRDFLDMQPPQFSELENRTRCHR